MVIKPNILMLDIIIFIRDMDKQACKVSEVSNFNINIAIMFQWNLMKSEQVCPVDKMLL